MDIAFLPFTYKLIDNGKPNAAPMAILELAEAAAVASLTAPDATSGILPEKALLENIRKFER